MAPFQLLLSQACRHCSNKPFYQLSFLIRSTPNSPFLEFHRSLSSPPDSIPESDNPPDKESTIRTRQPRSIQAVSYPINPKDPSPPQFAPPPLPSRLVKSMSSFLACRRLSTSVLTPESKAGAFPSHLLSTKKIVTPEHTQGLYQDLVIPVTNFNNEDKGFTVLAGDVFDVPIRKDIVHRVVRWQLAKRQQGTHSTKTISEVSGTGKKPWNQKGSGRARHGTLRGPQFRGGAIMHGPKPRSHAIKLNKKVRRLGLKITLSARAAEGKLLVFDDLEIPTHKTKNIVNYVNQMENTKKILLVDGGPLTEKLKLATQNLHYVNILPSIGLNVYSILLHDTLVMSRDAVNRIVERMHTPINR